MPLRGKMLMDPHTTVRAVTRVQCSSQNVLDFWMTLGCELKHELVKDGHAFSLVFDDHCLQARLSCMRAIAFCAHGHRHLRTLEVV